MCQYSSTTARIDSSQAVFIWMFLLICAEFPRQRSKIRLVDGISGCISLTSPSDSRVTSPYVKILGYQALWENSELMYVCIIWRLGRDTLEGERYVYTATLIVSWNFISKANLVYIYMTFRDSYMLCSFIKPCV